MPSRPVAIDPRPCVDRGYCYLKPEHWARPLDEREVQQVFDLHPSQRVQHPGPIPGTI